MRLTTPAVSVPLAISVLIPAQEALLLLTVLPDTVPKLSAQRNVVIPVIPAKKMNRMILVTVLPERLVLQDIIVLLTVPAANVRNVKKMKLKILVRALPVRR